ncbi:MAG: UDP-3-O-(3-hydroxymyristoyl)glucosamine N-acyltransferase [Acidisphaera sp.]|nr:UDP-3-O-(3-hydroxymyristoyl)glucosamine N-acyltransferase [Acidisphaera sp.]MBV9813932.1 UDP-3-O-(3-hydroxymyristoyl)glucosamine N-acyltransferase [Acetobacteraceae bacterium]
MTVGAVAGDERFFVRTGPHSLAAVAEAAGGTAPARELMLTGVAPLQSAAAAEVSFLDNRRYAGLLETTTAGAVILHPDLADAVPSGTVAIATPEPYLGWARVAALFHPPPPPAAGAHASAVIDPSARFDPTAEIGPLAVIGARAEIGARCRIGPGAVIGAGVVLGADCRVGAHASVTHAIVGERVYIYPGARIGQDGFGFAQGPRGFVTVPQLGRVILEDDVEVGANTTVDRGSVQDTVIGAGSRLDNLVMIGHNVRLGRCCVIVSQAGISGSTVLEDYVQVAGQAGLTGHLRIGAKARIGAQAGVMADVAAGADVVGSPATAVRTFFRQVAALRRLADAGRRGRAAGMTESD